MQQPSDHGVRGRERTVTALDQSLTTQGAGRVLIAGEFANNWGHLGCMLALARAYRDAGHEVLLAVSDLNAARFFFEADAFSVLQSPILRSTEHPVRQEGPAVNFADLLWGLGYSDTAALTVATEAWIALLAQIEPELLVYINAPTAAVAARVVGVRTIFTGGAFDIPPAARSLPVFRKMPGLPLARREAQVVEKINQQLLLHQKPLISRIIDLFPEKQVNLTTLAELDPFGPRPAKQYVGPVFTLPTIYRIGWKSRGSVIRIFVYLSPLAPESERILQALHSMQVDVLCVMPGCPSTWPGRFNTVTFYAQPLDLAFLLPQAHLVITGGVATTTTALLAGLPVLFVPRTLEQHLMASVLNQTGAGKVTADGQSVDQIARDISELMESTHYKQAALQIAMKYLGVEFVNNATVLLASDIPEKNHE